MKQEEKPEESPVPAVGEIFREKINSVNNLCMKRSADFAFEIGKRLREIWGQQKARDSWPDWCRENLIFDASTANRYLRIYEGFKDNPKALAGLTTSGALKLLAASKTGGGE
ncbi:MAG: DUF3102 domain-containing protein [Treponema sp.]|jgi:hypothetical protein|nr:DUF3102 domain-containing protein [Treponema sp.]